MLAFLLLSCSELFRLSFRCANLLIDGVGGYQVDAAVERRRLFGRLEQGLQEINDQLPPGEPYLLVSEGAPRDMAIYYTIYRLAPRKPLLLDGALSMTTADLQRVQIARWAVVVKSEADAPCLIALGVATNRPPPCAS